MATQRCVADTEVRNNELQAIVNKALGLPRKGVHIGGGTHCSMPDTWDGNGDPPPGWTKHATPVWSADATNSWLPISDAMATELLTAGPQSRLTGPERARLSAAIAARANVDPEAQGASPKASAAGQAAERADRP